MNFVTGVLFLEIMVLMPKFLMKQVGPFFFLPRETKISRKNGLGVTNFPEIPMKGQPLLLE